MSGREPVCFKQNQQYQAWSFGRPSTESGTQRILEAGNWCLNVRQVSNVCFSSFSWTTCTWAFLQTFEREINKKTQRRILRSWKKTPGNSREPVGTGKWVSWRNSKHRWPNRPYKCKLGFLSGFPFVLLAADQPQTAVHCLLGFLFSSLIHWHLSPFSIKLLRSFYFKKTKESHRESRKAKEER